MRGTVTTWRRSDPNRTVTLLPGASFEPGASWSTTSRVPLAASTTGLARTTPGGAVLAPGAGHLGRGALRQAEGGGLGHPHPHQHGCERGDLEQGVAGVNQPSDARGSGGDDAIERRGDSRQILVALGLPERELGLAVLELHLLRIRLRHHARRLERPLPLDPTLGVLVPVPRLVEGDGLIGILEGCEKLSPLNAATQVHQERFHDASRAREDGGVVLDVELGGKQERRVYRGRIRGHERRGRGGAAVGAGRACRVLAGPLRLAAVAGDRESRCKEGSFHDQILHQVSRAQRTGPRNSRVVVEAGSVSTRA